MCQRTCGGHHGNQHELLRQAHREKGESLSKIADHYYEDMKAYKKIFDANRDITRMMRTRSRVGQVLTIPNK